MGTKIKIIFLIIIIPFILSGQTVIAVEPDIADYTAYPPFVSQQVTPNVLIILDNSGSMNEFAYKDFDVSHSRGVPIESNYRWCWNGSGWSRCKCEDIFTNGYGSYGTDCPDDSYDPNEEYYGYFNPDKHYSYSSTAGGNFYEDSNGSWDGNFLNWLTMKRVDIVRKVLVGGKAVNRANPGSAKYLLGTSTADRNQFKQISDASLYTPFSGQRCFYIDDGDINVIDTGSCADYFWNYSSNIDATYTIKIKVGTEEPSGVVQKTWDQIRFGLMYFNDSGSKFEYGGSNNKDGGYIQDWISGPGDNVNLVTSIENTDPQTWTPLGESLYEATRLFRAITGAYQNANYAAHDPIQNKCQKNFVLILTDGESTTDRNLPGGAWGSPVSDPDGFNVKTYMDSIGANEGYSSQWNVSANSWAGTYYLEGVAYWSHITDLRPDDWDGTQNLTIYTVYAFDDSPVGQDLLKKTAKYGGFKDYNDNNIPDLQNEWDENGDSVPDTYFEAQEGAALESNLIQALTDILRRASSGTAVSVLATTGEGEGAIYQAYFFPEKIETESFEARKWLGYLHALFVDKYGNLREDSNGNNALDMTTDLIIEMEYSSELGTKINKYTDSDGDGEKDSETPTAIVNLDSVNAIWKGGETLWQTDPANRTIFTTIDGYNAIDFTTDNSTTLQPYLRAADTTEADNIINWVRGNDLTGVTDSGHPDGYRNRNITLNDVTNVWKLGDIVYSTPSVVGRPMENYDLLYGDDSYTSFRDTYLKRRHVVYVGANDGMLHAFNAGCFNESDHKYYPDVDSNGNCTSGSHTLGEELWAFIPRGLLPHLKWNTLIDYTHVYYVDLKPKITDVKIFNSDSTHIDGWGTILIGGFRYGGKNINWTSGSNNYSASPEYFALDITDPLNPRLLWTFSDPDLGLSMSYPSVAKVGGSWFVIFGSGATDYDSNSNLTTFQNGTVFVLKISGGDNGVIDTWNQNTNFWKISTGKSNTFLANSISVDVDIDYDVDVIYIAENYKQGSNWNTLMRRITTNMGAQASPAQWSFSTLGNVDSIAGNKDKVKKVTAAPSAAMDYRGSLWVFFGTGQFYGSDDKNNTDSGAFYAIKDDCWDGSCTSSYSNLLDISSATVTTDGSVAGVSGSCAGSVSSWANLLTASQSCDGWAMYFESLGETVDFTGSALTHNGERMLTKPLILGGLVTWATYIPGTDECSYEGESNVYAVYYQTGTAYKEYVFEEQKEMESPSDVVARVKKLGSGMPSSLSAQITSEGTIAALVQQSTGSILEIKSIAPFSLESGIIGWRSEQIP
jgi:type IV pilus assembly protein PilY1